MRLKDYISYILHMVWLTYAVASHGPNLVRRLSIPYSKKSQAKQQYSVLSTIIKFLIKLQYSKLVPLLSREVVFQRLRLKFRATACRVM